MDFSFTDEQQMLQDTTERFIDARYGFETRQKIRDGGQGWSAGVWQELAELGLLALMVPEADGGIGADGVAAMLVNRAMGSGLLIEPYLSSAIVATTAVAATPPGERRSALLAAMAAGELIAVLTDESADSLQSVEASPHADGWQLSGRKQVVYHAPLADLLLVPARCEGQLALFAVPADSAGLRRDAFVTLDDQQAAHVHFDAVKLSAGDLLAADATAAIDAAQDIGLASLCADAFGSLDRTLNATIEYSKARQQFGTPIGRFQVLQHRMADMFMQREQALSMSYLAATALANPEPASRRRDLSAAKVCIGEAARHIAQQSVQLHGGMGMTDELDVSHHFRRLTAFELRFGASDAHLRRFHAGNSGG
jgi:alkylation response protein AidB-like acyl-CoA dehydrogenase